jgi:hypothetical protein
MTDKGIRARQGGYKVVRVKSPEYCPDDILCARLLEGVWDNMFGRHRGIKVEPLGDGSYTIYLEFPTQLNRDYVAVENISLATSHQSEIAGDVRSGIKSTTGYDAMKTCDVYGDTKTSQIPVRFTLQSDFDGKPNLTTFDNGSFLTIPAFCSYGEMKLKHMLKGLSGEYSFDYKTSTEGYCLGRCITGGRATSWKSSSRTWLPKNTYAWNVPSRPSGFPLSSPEKPEYDFKPFDHSVGK